MTTSTIINTAIVSARKHRSNVPHSCLTQLRNTSNNTARPLRQFPGPKREGTPTPNRPLPTRASSPLGDGRFKNTGSSVREFPGSGGVVAVVVVAIVDLVAANCFFKAITIENNQLKYNTKPTTQKQKQNAHSNNTKHNKHYRITRLKAKASGFRTKEKTAKVSIPGRQGTALRSTPPSRRPAKAQLLVRVFFCGACEAALSTLRICCDM